MQLDIQNQKIKLLFRTEMMLLAAVVCAGIATFIINTLDGGTNTTIKIEYARAIAITNISILVLVYAIRHKRRKIEKQRDTQTKG